MYTLQEYEEYLLTEPRDKRATRLAAENDLVSFIRLVHPHTVLGMVHEDVCDFWQGKDAKTHQIVLLPRDHQKSRMKAYETVWQITKNPLRRHLYLSATANLAEKQLFFMKSIFESSIHRYYWPFHILPEEGKRTKWTASEIYLDHPLRHNEAIRDPSIFAAGLTTGKTGLHFDQIDFDDVVVAENAYTEDGRKKTADQASLLVSILGNDESAAVKVVGTRYHPLDLYNTMAKMQMEEFDDSDEVIGFEDVYEIFEKPVEDRGDGFGQFIWPRQQRADGKWFGFDRRILAKKRAQYTDRTQYYAQYYNNPNNPESEAISRSKFQYYDPKHLTIVGGQWYFSGARLNLTAAIDFNYSLDKRSDYTALVVVGVCPERNYYILDIDRFQTDSIKAYYASILALYTKWGFRKLICETTAAQQAIVKELRNAYIRPNGLALSLVEEKPQGGSGSKEIRIQSTLEPVYDNYAVWHYRGGHCQTLEDELILERPPHDDVKDALASAIAHSVPPARQQAKTSHSQGNVVFHKRFGGVRH